MLSPVPEQTDAQDTAINLLQSKNTWHWDRFVWTRLCLNHPSVWPYDKWECQTWSWTSSSQSSSCMMCSKGLKRASLKWKCGSSAQLLRTSIRTSWMKDTAFWDTCRSLWQAACGNKKRKICYSHNTEKNLLLLQSVLASWGVCLSIPPPGGVLPHSRLSSCAAAVCSCSSQCEAWPLPAGRGGGHYACPGLTLPPL